MQVDWASGLLASAGDVRESVKLLGQLDGVFANSAALRAMDPSTAVSQACARCPGGKEGGLFWGSTVVGRARWTWYAAHGHFHDKRDRTEYYGTVEGEGALILMDENRRTRMETMSPGSLHFIPPHTGHRVANTGRAPLKFVACWPADAGHDYDSIRKQGFSARLLNVNGSPTLVRSGS